MYGKTDFERMHIFSFYEINNKKHFVNLKDRYKVIEDS